MVIYSVVRDDIFCDFIEIIDFKILTSLVMKLWLRTIMIMTNDGSLAGSRTCHTFEKSSPTTNPITRRRLKTTSPKLTIPLENVPRHN